MSELSVVDAHVHFWDPTRLEYPWLDGLPALRRPFLPRDYIAAHAGVPVEKIVFVEANPRPDQGVAEARLVDALAAEGPRIVAIVAYVDLLGEGRDAALDELASIGRVRGIRHNIQGHPAGFCLQPDFVDGVREAGRRGLTFDLCATHDQLADVVELARRCPDTPLVLDHCGKPAIREGALDPWRGEIDRLAGLDHVWCKLSGLLTEADPAAWREEELLPYAAHVAERFGTGRLMYGSDWPVLTLAARSGGWYPFTRRFTEAWSAEDTRGFYHDNALRFYGV